MMLGVTSTSRSALKPHHTRSSLGTCACSPQLIPLRRHSTARLPAPRRTNSAASFQPEDSSSSSSTSMEQLQLKWRLQSLQQRRPQQADPPTAQSGEETELLWAGYSALEDQVRLHQRRHEALTAQLQELQGKLHAVQQQQQQQQQPSAPTAWQAASFLLFFLFFINTWAMVANFQMGWALPWAASKQAAGGLWLKQLLGWAVPLTNTIVVLIFCMQAVKAAWTCLRL